MRKKLELSASEVTDMLLAEAYKRKLIPQIRTDAEWTALKVSTDLVMDRGIFTAEISWESK